MAQTPPPPRKNLGSRKPFKKTKGSRVKSGPKKLSKTKRMINLSRRAKDKNIDDSNPTWLRGTSKANPHISSGIDDWRKLMKKLGMKNK